MKIQELRKLIKEEIQNVLNEATDFSSFKVLDPGTGHFSINYNGGAFLAFYDSDYASDSTITLVGSQPQEQKYFDEIAQTVGNVKVTPNSRYGFELTIPKVEFEKLFGAQ
jgi:hypothetical protein